MQKDILYVSLTWRIVHSPYTTIGNKYVSIFDLSNMRLIKCTFITKHWHHCSPKFRAVRGHEIKTSRVSGLYFSEYIDLTLTDSQVLSKMISNVQLKNNYYKKLDWEGYGYIDDEHETFSDYGICADFNNAFSLKYQVELISGDISECPILFAESKQWIHNVIDKVISDCEQQRRSTLFKESAQIEQLERKVRDIRTRIQYLQTNDGINEFAFEPLEELLVNRINNFDVNEVIINNVFPIDIAIARNNQQLLEQLISLGAFRYSGKFMPELSAKLGDFNHSIDLLQVDEICNADMNDFYEFISYLPNDELFNFFDKIWNNLIIR